jgi:hypothetical protein
MRTVWRVVDVLQKEEEEGVGRFLPAEIALLVIHSRVHRLHRVHRVDLLKGVTTRAVWLAPEAAAAFVVLEAIKMERWGR